MRNLTLLMSMGPIGRLQETIVQRHAHPNPNVGMRNH